MTGLNLPIPQGFTVTTEACTNYYDCGGKISDEVASQVIEDGAKWERLGRDLGKRFETLKILIVLARSEQEYPCCNDGYDPQSSRIE